MIKPNNRMLIEFGMGDILVGSALCDDGVGVLTFDEASTRHEIGESVSPNEDTDLFDVPLVMSFLDIRSVDVLIDNLNNIRIGMKNYEYGRLNKEETK